jgi:hypothetical protein
MAVVEITPTRLSDVWAFEKMRPADAAEVLATGSASPIAAVLESWEVSEETWTARINGEVAAVFGVALHPQGELLAPLGVVWLLTTTAVDKSPIAFYRRSKQVAVDFHARYGRLVNYVDARYAQALAWAARIGFTVHPPMKFGTKGELFHPIVYGG